MFHGSSLQLITAISVTVTLHLHFLHLFLSGVYTYLHDCNIAAQLIQKTIVSRYYYLKQSHLLGII